MARAQSSRWSRPTRVRRVSPKLARGFWKRFCKFLQEQMPWGVIGLDRDGRLVCKNWRATSFLARGDGLTIRHGVPHAMRAADDRKLQLKLAQMRGAPGDGDCRAMTLGISRGEGLPPYLLRIVPTSCGDISTAQSIPAFLIIISAPGTCCCRSYDDLRDVLGLTPREAELTLLVGGGMSLCEAAGRMRISHNTARVHLAHVMRKTGAHSQAALVSLLDSMPTDDTGI